MKVLINEKLSEHKYKTPEGYLICVDAVLARTGKQSYRKSEIFNTDDNTEIEVDRQPNEVFSEATLASFENKPITVEHPDEDVNSGNIKEYAVGFVRDVHKGYDNGQPVILGTLVIQDAETIEEIENGEHTDLSCGYDCDINDEENPQQRNIRGNHVALCQCGRAGNARIVDSVKDSNLSNAYAEIKRYYPNAKLNMTNHSIIITNVNELGSGIRSFLTNVNKKYGRAVLGFGGSKTYEPHIVNNEALLFIDSQHYKTIKDSFYVIRNKYKDIRICNTIDEAKRLQQSDMYKSGDIYRIDSNIDLYKRIEAKFGQSDVLDELMSDIRKGKAHLVDSIKDELYSLQELREMRIDNYRGVDLYKIHEQYSTNPNTSNRRFNTLEQLKDYIDDYFYFKDSVTDATEYRIVNYNGKWYYEMKQDDGFVKLVGPYISEKEAREYFVKHRPNEKLRDVEPRENESKEDFISRFMSETKEEYPDEKQRLAIAYSYWNKKSTKDEETPYQEVTKNLEKSINDQSDLSLLKEYFNERQPNKKMELRHKLKEMNYKEGVSGVNSRELMWVELNGKRYEIKNLSSVKPLDSIKDDYFTSLPDKVKKSEFNDLYYKIREQAEKKWNYRVSTYGDKFKIEVEKAVGAAPGTYGPVGGQWKTIKTIYSIEDSAIKDSKTPTKLSTIVKLVKAVKVCKDSVETVSEWIKKINGISVEAAILKHSKGYTFRSSIIREDRDFNSYEYAIEYAKALNYKMK